jgi:hypothetical protein
MRGSSYWNDLIQEKVANFNGVNQNVSDEKMLMAGQTNQADGFSTRGGTLKTNQFGFCGLPVNWTRSATRCYGIVPSTENGKFYTIFSKVNSTSLTTNRDLVSMFDMSATALDGTNPKLLVSSSIMNNHIIMADGASLRKYSGSTVFDDLVRVPPAPTFNSDTGTGYTGTVYYRCTLVDTYGNETGGGNISDAHTVANLSINPTIDITGFDSAVYGYKTIRWFRTVTQPTPSSDLTDMTFYYLQGSDSTIIPGLSTYTINDNTVDTVLDIMDEMENPKPVVTNGQGFYADVVLAFQNRILGIGITENGTYYPSRVRWSGITDSTATSAGNILSWHSFDYTDECGPNDSDPAIGAFVMGDRVYVSKRNGMYSLTPTYSSDRGQQFATAQISDRHGFYHHTVQDIGGSFIGRSTSGVLLFNGSSFKPVSTPIQQTISRCGSLEGDVSAYDAILHRYYISVYDPQIRGSVVKTGTNQGLVEMFRNTLVCFDLDEDKVEIHPGVYIQAFCKLNDTQSNTAIFCGGNSRDIMMLLNDCEQMGPTYSFLGTVAYYSITTSGTSLVTPEMVGKTVKALAYVDAANSKFMFTNFSSTVIAVNGGNLALANNENLIPDFNPTATTMLFSIDAAYGSTNTHGVTTSIVDSGTNYFNALNLDYYTFSRDTDGTGYYFDAYRWKTNATVTNSTTLAITSHGMPATGTHKYLLMPVNASAGIDMFVPYHRYLVPAFGVGDATNEKVFRHLMIRWKGRGVVRVKTFIDGSTDADQTIFITLPDATLAGQGTAITPYTYSAKLINLKGTVGQYMRVELNVWRGAGWLNVQEINCYYRKLPGFRHNA